MRARSNAACGGQEGMFGVVQVGDNREQEDDSCPERCEYEASYVCGFNGEQYRIFGNNCTFKLVACRSKESKLPMESFNYDQHIDKFTFILAYRSYTQLNS